MNELSTVQLLNKRLFEEELFRDSILNTDWPLTKDGEEYFSERIINKDKKYLCLVALDNGTIVGYLAGAIRSAHPQRPIIRAELENMIIDSKLRSKGIGSKLFTKFSSWAKSQGAQKLIVRVYTQNTDALKFYQKHGFSELSKVLEKELS